MEQPLTSIGNDVGEVLRRHSKGGKVQAYKMVGSLIPADRMVFGVITGHGYFLKIFKICVYPKKSAFYATENLAIFADFCQN